MSPQGPDRPTAQHRGMEHDPALDAFNAALASELYESEDPGPPEAMLQRPAASAFEAVQRARARAASHENCPPDIARTYDLLILVTGSDGVSSIHHLEPGVPAHCVMGELYVDPSIQRLALVGVHEDPPEPEVTEAGGVIVTSETPGMVAVFDGDIEPGPKHLRRPWWRRWAA